MIEPLVFRAVGIEFRTEGLVIKQVLRSFVYDRSFIAIERSTSGVCFDEVLHHLRADALEEEAQVSEERVVPENAVAGLDPIPDRDRSKGSCHCSAEEEPWREEDS